MRAQNTGRIKTADHQRSRPVNPIGITCTAATLNCCNEAGVKNSYQIVTALTDIQIFVLCRHSKVIEDCDGVLHTKQIREDAFISSACHLLIGASVFS